MILLTSGADLWGGHPYKNLRAFPTAFHYLSPPPRSALWGPNAFSRVSTCDLTVSPSTTRASNNYRVSPQPPFQLGSLLNNFLSPPSYPLILFFSLCTFHSQLLPCSCTSHFKWSGSASACALPVSRFYALSLILRNPGVMIKIFFFSFFYFFRRGFSVWRHLVLESLWSYVTLLCYVTYSPTPSWGVSDSKMARAEEITFEFFNAIACS